MNSFLPCAPPGPAIRLLTISLGLCLAGCDGEVASGDAGRSDAARADVDTLDAQGAADADDVLRDAGTERNADAGERVGDAAPLEDAGAGGEGDAGVDAAAAPCAPVRHHVVPLGVRRPLSCVPPGAPVEILRAAIDDRGIAVARMQLVMRGTGAPRVGVHGWAGAGDVGDATFSRRITWGAGEGLCPLETGEEALLAFGELTDADHEVAFSVHQYRSSDCVDGTIVIEAASTLEVWVEDPRPHCRGQDIVASSYFQRVWDTYGAGADRPVSMTTDPTPMLDAEITLATPATVTLIGQTEISPSATANVCGGRVETGFAVTTGSDGTSLVNRDVFAASGGGAHVLIPVRFDRSLGAGTTRFELAAGVDQAVRVGALAGATFSGDTLLFLIAQR